MASNEISRSQPEILGYLDTEQQRLPVRYATPEDLPALRRMRTDSASWVAEIPETNGQWLDSPEGLEDWSASMLDHINARHTLIVPYKEDGLPGITLTRYPDGNLLLFTQGERAQPAVYISSLMRRRMGGEVDPYGGEGSYLLDFVADEARRDGARYMRLDTWYTNYGLPKVYTDYGFEPLPSRKWESYPAGRLFQYDLNYIERSVSAIPGYQMSSALFQEKGLYPERDLFETTPTFTPRFRASWASDNDFPVPGKNKYGSFCANAVDGWMTYPPPIGEQAARWLLGASPGTRGAVLRAAGIQPANTPLANIYGERGVPLSSRPAMIGRVGLAEILFAHQRASSISGKVMGVRALEQPIEDSEAFGREFADLEARALKGSLLLRGVFRDGGLEIADKRFDLKFDGQAEREDDVIVDSSFRPPKSGLSLPPHSPEEGDLLMARLRLPVAGPGRRNFFHADLVRLDPISRRG